MELAPQSARYSTAAALVTFPAMIGNWGKASRNILTVSPTPLLWPCAVDTATAFNQRADVIENTIPVQLTESGARGGHSGPAHEPKLSIASGLELGIALLRDA